MNLMNRPEFGDDPRVWEDLVKDYLEVACALSEEESACLMNALRASGTNGNAIYAYPSFAIGQRLIVVRDEGDTKESWLFYPKEQKIVIHFPASNGRAV